jgi:hypothetical protein
MMKNSNFENLIGAIVCLIMIIVFFVLSVLFGLLLQLSAENPQKFKEIIMMTSEFRLQLSKWMVIISVIILVIIIINWSYILIKHKNSK